MLYQLSSITAESFIDNLSKKWSLSEGLLQTFEGAYFDTFDWRLYLAGYALFVERYGKGFMLHLTAYETGVVHVGIECAEQPGMLESLPPGEVHDALAPVMEMRRLLPLATTSGRRRQLCLLDGNGKTVVRIEIAESIVGADGDAEHLLPLSVLVSPLKGYEKDAARLDEWVRRQFGGVGGIGPHLDAALEAVGRHGGDYSSKLDFQLAPLARTDVEIKLILLHLLTTLEKNVDGVCNDIDSEFLHDLRVAVRRTRSALSQIKAVFDPDVVERFKQDFAWMGQITGPTRDLDVYLLKFPCYLNSLPPSYRDAMDPFHRYLEQHQALAQRELTMALRSRRFTEAMREWRTFLEAQPSKKPPEKNAAKMVKEVADVRISRMYRRVMKDGAAIDDDTPAEALHELRKNCKKLRYLMEFFQSLYPTGQIMEPIKAVKALLENLGNFQDFEVQATKLESMAGEMRRTRVNTHSLLAMGMLINGLLHHQQQARELFTGEFRKFSGKRNQRLFADLFEVKGVARHENRRRVQHQGRRR